MHFVRYIQRDFYAIDDGKPQWSWNPGSGRGKGHWKLHQWIPH